MSQALIDELKKEAHEYALQTNVPLNLDKIKELFTLIYRKMGYSLPQIYVVDSPVAAQKKANELMGNKESKTVYYDFSHSSLSHAIYSYKYVMQTTPDRIDDELKAITNAFNCFYYSIVFDEALIVSEFPTSISVDSSFNYNAWEKPALAFKDGVEMYFIAGKNVDKEIAMRKVEDWTAKDIFAISDVDVRAQVLNRIGPTRMATLLAAREIERKDGYRLLSIKMFDNGEEGTFLDMINPSMNEGIPTFKEAGQKFYELFDKDGLIRHVEGVRGKTVAEALRFRNNAEKYEFVEDFDGTPSQLT